MHVTCMCWLFNFFLHVGQCINHERKQGDMLYVSLEAKHTQNDIEDDFADPRDTKDHVEEDETNH